MITNNFGLLTESQFAAIGWFGSGEKSKKKQKHGEDNSIDTFKELTNTIDDIIEALPNIVIPSTIIGKSRIEGIKEIVKLYKKQNMNKVMLLSCTVINLIARHSGATELSRVAGFMQNCLALYSIGDSLCNRITFNWDYADTIYIVAHNDLEGGVPLTMTQYRDLCVKYEKNNYDGITLTNSSIYVLANMMISKSTQKWFSSIDQTEHTITTGRTNIKGVSRQLIKDEDSNSESYELRYDFTDSALASGKPSNAVFELIIDNVLVYLIQTVTSFADDDNSAITLYEPNRDFRYFWIPMDGVELSRKEVMALNENISHYLNMLFVNNIDTKRFMFTFDDQGDLTELVRPTAIPSQFVSKEIPKIIAGIKNLHDKKLSRCYALVGHAGTGKTIGAQQISNMFMDTCTFKITKSVIENPEILESMMTYIKAIGRCIIILDDMDRSNLSEKNDSVCAYLNFFDGLNQAAKNDQVSYVFIATINDPDKINKVIMCRSGRIDEMCEIGFPDVDAMRYLFQYNDRSINPDNLSNFDDSEFDAVFKEAMEAEITAADIGNIFTDMAIYGTKGEKITPDAVRDAIARIKTRNSMATNRYLDK